MNTISVAALANVLFQLIRLWFLDFARRRTGKRNGNSPESYCPIPDR